MVARLAAALLLLLLMASADRAVGHGLGQRYDLPIPLSLYLLGAASAVAVSFAFLAFFRVSRRKLARTALPRRRRVRAFVIAALRVISVASFLLVVAAGLIGNQNPFKNIAPVAVWVVWWVGFSFLCAFVVDVWPIASPFATIFAWGEQLVSRCTGRPLAPRLRYPRWLGAWPAVFAFLLFAWFELIAPARDSPRVIAIVVLAYAAGTWLGCWLFGPRIWLRNSEAFAVAFRLLGRFAPFAVARVSREWRWWARAPGSGLLRTQPLSASLAAFVLLMLATVTVDGFLETPLWAGLLESLTPAAPSPLSLTVPRRWPATLLLCVAPVLFGLGYAGVMQAMNLLAPSGQLTGYLARRFVLTLVPIGIAYHLAHYFSFLLLAGQFVIPLASDPFGFGWDLFGTSLYRIDIGIVSARTTWFVAVGAIVIGHVLATWLAHETALDIYKDARAVRLSQVPILALMIGYTVLSLWILAQPIVEVSR